MGEVLFGLWRALCITVRVVAKAIRVVAKAVWAAAKVAWRAAKAAAKAAKAAARAAAAAARRAADWVRPQPAPGRPVPASTSRLVIASVGAGGASLLAGEGCGATKTVQVPWHNGGGSWPVTLRCADEPDGEDEEAAHGCQHRVWRAVRCGCPQERDRPGSGPCRHMIEAERRAAL